MRNFIKISFLLLFVLSACKNAKSNRNDKGSMDNRIVEGFSFSPQNSQIKVRNLPEYILIDLNNDNILDTIILTDPKTTDDIGDFNKIILSISGISTVSFLAKDVWDSIDNSFLAENKNAVKSRRIFVYRNPQQTILLLFGYVYGAGRSEFTVIQVKRNIVKMIYDDALEYPKLLKDWNNNDTIELLGRNAYETYRTIDSLHAEIGTYSPYLIFNIESGFPMNKSLTKKYNEDNYIFAGFDYSENIEILYPHNHGRPSIYKYRK